MDKSEKYIEMCSKAEEIQHNSLQIGDYVKPMNFDEVEIISDIERYNNFDFVNFGYRGNCIADDCIWLPRQDQLQDMIKIKENYPGSFLYQHMENLDEMIFNLYNDEHSFLQSYEKIWLIYVMCKNYNKIWNGVNWERIND